MSAISPIEAHLRAAERRLIATFALQPRALPPGLGERTGEWKDAPVMISTRAYEGDAVGYVRVALVSGVQLVIGSLLAIPRANRPVPVLGADLSWSGARRETTIVADLTPVRDALERESELAAIARAAPSVARLPSGGELLHWHSASALNARVGPALEDHALDTFDGYVAGFITLLAAATPSPERAPQVRTMHDAYALAHRTDDERLRILGRMFGATWAEEYVRRVLFPVMSRMSR